MNESKVKLNLRNFRAIKEANILLNGVTVVSGINGCGKSTLSKLLYYIFKTINNFNYVVINKNIEKFNQYKDIFSFIIDSMVFRNHSFSERRNIRKKFSGLFTIPYNFNEMDIEDILDNIEAGINIIRSFDRVSFNDDRLALIVKGKLIELGVSDLEISHQKTVNNMLNYLMEKASNEIRNILYKIFEEFESKPRKYLDDIIRNIFKTENLPSLMDVYEFESKLISNDDRKIIPSYLIKNAIYIDTPMSFQSLNRNYEYWDDLNNLLNSKDYLNKDYEEIYNKISREILDAEINLNREHFYNQFVYHRLSDNLKLELENCATGIKSLSILYILIRNGTINSNSILIIDEPEAHLHPQWIFEYAKILVLLKKEIGCNLFISSHNPDFIQALSVISEKEGINNELNFYLAEEQENRTFSYKNLENNIGPIFKCFNKSLDKIESY